MVRAGPWGPPSSDRDIVMPDKEECWQHALDFLIQPLWWGVSNHWNGIWNGTMEWKMEWNSEHTQLQLTRVTGAAQFRLNYLVYL